MNTKDLAGELAVKSGLQRTQSTRVVQNVFNLIAKALKDGERVSIHNFGVFKTNNRKAREGINPVTKERIQIKASKGCLLTPTKHLKDVVNGRQELEEAPELALGKAEKAPVAKKTADPKKAPAPAAKKADAPAAAKKADPAAAKKADAPAATAPPAP